MDANDFRRAATDLPEVEEREHQDHPDFRVGGKVFASLGRDGAWGMVKLDPDDQARRVAKDPALYEPFAGAWGKHGCTKVHLARCKDAEARDALAAAWRNVAPKKVRAAHEGEL